MAPRPAPDLTSRRTQLVHAARRLAESEGWAAVTMRRLAAELGVTQPVVYSVFDGRQALVDAVALDGFAELATALETAGPAPEPSLRAYLEFAAAQQRLYEAMFALPSELRFAAADTPAPLRRAFAAIAAAFPDEDGTRAELAWSVLHGLAMLAAAGRLRPTHQEQRIELARTILSGTAASPGD